MVGDDNIKTLQRGVEENAPKFTFYKMDKSMKNIPTATHKLPGK